MWRRLLLLALSALLIGATAALPQVIVPNPPGALVVAFEHDGANTDYYTLQLDGEPPLTMTITARPDLGPTVKTMPVPAMTPGTHTITVAACNAAGCTAAPPLTVISTLLPLAPSATRIVAAPPGD